MVQRAVDHENGKVSGRTNKTPNKVPLKNQEGPKLAGTLVSVFFVLGFIAVTWFAMFMTYSSRL